MMDQCRAAEALGISTHGARNKIRNFRRAPFRGGIRASPRPWFDVQPEWTSGEPADTFPTSGHAVIIDTTARADHRPLRKPMSRRTVLVITLALFGSTTLAAQSASEQIEPQAISIAPHPTAMVPTDSLAPVLVFAQPAGLLAARTFDDRLSPQDTLRRKSVAYSDWYALRLRVHRYGSYTMLPLFVAEYVLGNKLLKQKDAQYDGTRTTPVDQNLRNAHSVVAGGVAALFIVNTTTGLWNSFASRHTVEGRKLRTIHALTMLTADAGFLYTGYLSSQAVNHGPPDARKHRNVAVASFSIATAGASLMWFTRH